MKFKQVPLLVVCVVGSLTIVSGLCAQRIGQVNPRHITLRAISLSSLKTGMMVGDSGYIAVTHHALGINNWTNVKNPFGQPYMLDAVAYAGDTSHAVIGGEHGSLASTGNGGTNWKPVALGTTVTIRALTWNTSSTDCVLVGVGDSGLIIRSTDQGKSWKIISAPTSAQLNAIAFGTSDEAIAVGNDTTILQSHDAGQTWSRMAFPYNFQTLFKGAYNALLGHTNFVGVAMSGTDSVWVASDSAIVPLLLYKGTAADTSQAFFDIASEPWLEGTTNIYPTFTSILYMGMPNAITGLPGFCTTLTTSPSDIQIYTTRDDATMNSDPTPLIGDVDGNADYTPIRNRAAAIWKEDTTVLVIEVGDECSMYRYLWTPHAFGNQSALSFIQRGFQIPGRQTSVEFLDVQVDANNFGFSIGADQSFERTIDGGRTWTNIDLNITHVQIQGTTDSAFNAVYVLDSSSAIIVGWNGLIIKYDTTGTHILSSGTSERLHGITFPSPDTGIIVGDYGSIFRTTDRGNTWGTISTTTSEYLYSIAFANERIGVAVGNNGTILRTTDEGTTWNSVNNILSGQPVEIRQVQAFPNGTFFARAESSLIRSNDFGSTWQFVNPPVGDTDGMSFYSPSIGIVGESTTSSQIVPDTARLAYTLDGGSTWHQFSVSIWNYNRILFHWLNDHEVLLYGIDGFIVDVDLTASGVPTTRVVSRPAAALSVYPNPSSGEVRVEYTTTTSGAVQIELWDEAGKKITSLWSSNDAMGDHSRFFSLPSDLHGAYFIRLTSDGTVSNAPMVIK